MPRTRFLILALLILGHLTLDLFVPPLFTSIRPEGPYVETIFLAGALGVCLSQIDLIALWAALASGPVAVRVPWSLFLGGLMWNALVAGNRWLRQDGAAKYFSSADATALALAILVGLAFVLLPLWIARRFFHWRLRIAAEAPALDTSRSAQFSLAQLMLGTALFSVTLGLGRLSFPLVVALSTPPLGELSLIVAVCSLVNLVTVLPCVWGAFAPRRLWPPLALGWMLYALFATGLEIGTFIVFLGGGDETGRLMFVFYIINLAQCASVFLTFALLRAAGFQFVRNDLSFFPLVPVVAELCGDKQED